MYKTYKRLMNEWYDLDIVISNWFAYQLGLISEQDYK